MIAQEIDIQLPEEVHLLVLVHEFLLFIDSGKGGDIARGIFFGMFVFCLKIPLTKKRFYIFGWFIVFLPDKWRFRLNEATGEYYWLCKEMHKTSREFPYKTEL